MENTHKEDQKENTHMRLSTDGGTLPVNAYLDIEVPTTASSGPQQTLRHLLKVTEEAKKNDSNAQPPSEEDVLRVSNMSPEEMKKWTDIVLGKVPGMISDAEKVRQRILPALVKANRTNKRELMDELVQLNYLVEITPIVDVFLHAGGVNVLKPLFVSEFEDVREAVWLCLATCVQNNIKFQRHLLGLELSKTLLDLLEKETSGKVQYKILSVIGGYLRGFEPSCKDLLEINAMDRLLGFSCSKDISPKVFLRTQRVLDSFLESSVESSETVLLPCMLKSTTLLQVRNFLASSGYSDSYIQMLKDFLKGFAGQGPEFQKLLVDSGITSFLEESELKLEDNMMD